MMTILLWIYFGSAMIAFAIAFYEQMNKFYAIKNPIWVDGLICLIPVFNSLFVLKCVYEGISMILLINRIKGRLK